MGIFHEIFAIFLGTTIYGPPYVFQTLNMIQNMLGLGEDSHGRATLRTGHVGHVAAARARGVHRARDVGKTGALPNGRGFCW